MQQAMLDGNKAECREPSVMAMRLKADWESATPLYEKAATAFSVSLSRHWPGHRQQHLATSGERAGECDIPGRCWSFYMTVSTVLKAPVPGERANFGCSQHLQQVDGCCQ